MKANIEIKFMKIGNVELSKKIVDDVGNLLPTAEKTVRKLCRTIEKYFHKKKIIVITESNVTNN